MHKGITTTALIALVCVLLSGCASDQSRKAEYKRAVVERPLEVPPDLVMPDALGNTTLPQSYLAQLEQTGKTAEPKILVPQHNVRVMRDGGVYWLEVDAAPEALWAELHKFWEQQGLDIKRDEPKLGIMETAWAENKADVPDDWLTGMVSSVLPGLYKASTRDKFRLRMERGSGPDTTEVFVTHYGIEEVQRGENAVYYDTVWQLRPADPELVVEMLNRMMVYMGTPQDRAGAQLAQATAPTHFVLAQDGKSAVVNENFARAWRRVGIALDRLGLVVEDRDRSAGLYYIRAVDPLEDAGVKSEGFFSGWFTDDAAKVLPTPARIHLQDSGVTTRVVVEDKEGQQDTSAAALKILKQLEAELR